MAYTGSITSGNEDSIRSSVDTPSLHQPDVLGARKIFKRFTPARALSSPNPKKSLKGESFTRTSRMMK